MSTDNQSNSIQANLRALSGGNEPPQEKVSVSKETFEAYFRARVFEGGKKGKWPKGGQQGLNTLRQNYEGLKDNVTDLAKRTNTSEKVLSQLLSKVYSEEKARIEAGEIESREFFAKYRGELPQGDTFIHSTALEAYFRATLFEGIVGDLDQLAKNYDDEKEYILTLKSQSMQDDLLQKLNKVYPEEMARVTRKLQEQEGKPSTPEPPAASVEEYFRVKLLEWADGDLDQLAQNYGRLKEAIELEAMNHKRANAALSFQAREEADKLNKANTDSLSQLLNSIYYEETARITVRVTKLPPAPELQLPRELKGFKPVGQNGLALRAAIYSAPITLFILFVLAALGVSGFALLALAIVIAVCVWSPIDNKLTSREYTKKMLLDKVQAQHEAEYKKWLALKKEVDVRQRAEKTRDELSKILHNQRL